MAKPTDITFEYGEDYRGQGCLIVRKQKGKLLTRQSVLEAMEKNDIYGAWYMPVVFFGDLADDLYDGGDMWMLYEADSISEKISQDRYSEGYEDGQRDTNAIWKEEARRHGWQL